jgi:hypothetical protein
VSNTWSSGNHPAAEIDTAVNTALCSQGVERKSLNECPDLLPTNVNIKTHTYNFTCSFVSVRNLVSLKYGPRVFENRVLRRMSGI